MYRFKPLYNYLKDVIKDVIDFGEKKNKAVKLAEIQFLFVFCEKYMGRLSSELCTTGPGDSTEVLTVKPKREVSRRNIRF